VQRLVWIAGAGVVAGAVIALAGGGSFVSMPALIATGVPSVTANASSTVGLFPGGVASAWVYRGRAGSIGGAPFPLLVATTVVGGLVGGLLLLDPRAVSPTEAPIVHGCGWHAALRPLTKGQNGS
jgi:uncharacterized protein